MVIATAMTCSISAAADIVDVVTWNIKTDQSASRARQEMAVLAALTPLPQIIVLNEANSSNLNIYIQELETQTHRRWSLAFQPHCRLNRWNTATSSCDAAEDEGVAILTTLAITSSDGRYFPSADCWHSARGGLHAAIAAGSTVVQVFAAHLQTGRCQNDAESRLASIASLKAWARDFPSPQLIGGDFNALPSSTEIASGSRGMTAAFIDAWSIAGFGDGYTFDSARPNRRFDYWFSRGAIVRAVSVPTPPSSLSDHLPVQASFTLAD
jgi:endonuclease/exonuclease/phosphatase family metal-dependent hydrolase